MVVSAANNHFASPLTLLHLGDQLLVKQAPCLLVQRAVDGDDIALRQHLLEVLDASAANLLLLLGRQGLVVEVQQLLAVEGRETAQHALADAAHGDGADDLVLQVVLVLGHGRDVPVAGGDLLVGRHEVADQHQDGHDDVLGHGHDVGARDLGDGDAAIGLVGGVEVDVVGADARGDGELEVLCLGEALCGQVARVESAVPIRSARSSCIGAKSQLRPSRSHKRWGACPVVAGHGREVRGSLDVRRGDDDLGVDEMLVELGVLALLVRRRDERVALLLDPLPDAQLVLSRSEELRLLLGVLAALPLVLIASRAANCSHSGTYIVEDEEDFALLF